MEIAWLYAIIGVFIGVLVRNLYYTYRKVSKKGEKFKWEFVATAITSAIIVVWGIVQGNEHIEIPIYVVEKGWWALIGMGVMIGFGANDILNVVLKTVKPPRTETPLENNSEEGD